MKKKLLNRKDIPKVLWQYHANRDQFIPYNLDKYDEIEDCYFYIYPNGSRWLVYNNQQQAGYVTKEGDEIYLHTHDNVSMFDNKIDCINNSIQALDRQYREFESSYNEYRNEFKTNLRKLNKLLNSLSNEK